MTEEILFGERIAKARASRGYSAAQLAQRLGIKSSTIDRWERGETSPRANSLNQLAGVLNVPLLWLMAGADSPPSVTQPHFSETRAMERQLEKAEALLTELSFLMVDIRAQARKLQRGIDED